MVWNAQHKSLENYFVGQNDEEEEKKDVYEALEDALDDIGDFKLEKDGTLELGTTAKMFAIIFRQAMRKCKEDRHKMDEWRLKFHKEQNKERYVA